MTPNATAGEQRFRAAIEAGDIAAATALFTEDAVFNSPVVHKPYRGREPLGQILRAAFTVFENFRYTAQYRGPGGHVLEVAAQVGDLEVHGVDMLRAGGWHVDRADRPGAAVLGGHRTAAAGGRAAGRLSVGRGMSLPVPDLMGVAVFAVLIAGLRTAALWRRWQAPRPRT